jgi:hypothetical protein
MIALIEDQMEIENLAARYNQAIDLGNPQAWVDCFIPDGEFSIVEVGHWSSSVRNLEVGTWRGHSELLTFAARVAASGLQRHWSTNRILTLDEEGMDSISYMTILYLDTSDASGLLTGIMRDRLVRLNGEWRFQARRITFDR